MLKTAEIGVLASGDLGLSVLSTLAEKYNINFVLTDRNSKVIIDFCIEKGIFCYAGNPRNGAGTHAIGNMTCDTLVSVNYLFIIEKDLIDRARIHAINFHGSLLPKYRGRTPHVWAIINGENETGISAHIISKECDTGDILEQRKRLISQDDTGGAILDWFKQEYPAFVCSVIDNIASGNYKLSPQDHSAATWFDKRTPDDGRINWNWDRRRIYNWIRAQARPYPGAFTFYGNYKLTVHKSVFSEISFDPEGPNGKIVALKDGCPVVKTQDGCLILLDFECDTRIDIFSMLK